MTIDSNMTDQFTIIVENDVTEWHDDTGVAYHYPRRYRRFLAPGTRLIHYKGKLRDSAFKGARLSEHPHYFGVSVAGDSYTDPSSSKGDLFVKIVDFEPFRHAVHYKDTGGNYREVIPATRQGNFWRDGVRPTTEAAFLAILTEAGAQVPAIQPPTADDELTSVLIEGGKKVVYSTRYERKPALREKAIAIHGTSCFACEVDLHAVYGVTAKGFIHVHHRRPLYLTGETPVDPSVDLVPLCPTCHSIVHLGGKLRTVNQVRGYLGKGPIALGN
ncbi:MAG: HNH endonuclease [Devosia sp.]